jgi:hypothetical protein
MLWLIGLLLFGASAEPVSPPGEPLWTANLAQEYGFQRFDREINKNWLAQQGLVFLSPERVAIYQLNQKPERVKLSPRDASGGAGNFYLQVEILDIHDGHEIARLRLPACGMFSNVMPARDGNFIVRTGEMLSLYSPALQQVASHRLPLEKGESQVWETNMAASGDVVVAIRRQMYPDLAMTGKPTYVEVLDAATLQLKNAFTAQHAAGWLMSVGDRHILSLAPAGGWQWSLMDFEGHWDQFDPSRSPLTRFRYRRLGLLAHDYLAAYGAEQLVVMSNPTEAIFTVVEPHQFFQSVVSADRFLAVEILNRPPTYKNGRAVLPNSAQVAAYDLKSQAKLLSVEVSPKGLYFAISPQGDLGIIHHDQLEILRGVRPK